VQRHLDVHTPGGVGDCTVEVKADFARCWHRDEQCQPESKIESLAQHRVPSGVSNTHSGTSGSTDFPEQSSGGPSHETTSRIDGCQ
jgi:hypothetical protein